MHTPAAQNGWLVRQPEVASVSVPQARPSSGGSGNRRFHHLESRAVSRDAFSSCVPKAPFSAKRACSVRMWRAILDTAGFVRVGRFRRCAKLKFAFSVLLVNDLTCLSVTRCT